MAESEAVDLESQLKLLNLNKFISASDKGNELISLTKQFVKVTIFYIQRIKGKK